MFAIISAMAENRVIGDKGGLPWHLPLELAYFKSVVQGHRGIVGRKTYDTSQSALREVSLVVLSRNQKKISDGINWCADPAILIKEHKNTKEKVFVLGGQKIYEIFLPHVSEIYLTIVHDDFAGDRFFPEFDAALFQAHALETCEENGTRYTKYIYTRI